MARKKKGQALGPTPVQEGLPSTDIVESKPTAHQDMVEELRRWMTSDSKLLLWLEDDANRTDALFAGIDDLSTSDTELRSRVAAYEAEITQLKEEMQKSSSRMSSEETERLKDELARTSALYDELRQRFEQSMAGGKEEIGELEQRSGHLREWEKDLEKRERILASGQASLDEAEMEKRFEVEYKEKEAEFEQTKKELKGKIEQLELDLKQKLLNEKLKEEELKLTKLQAPAASKELETRIRDIQDKEKKIMELELSVGKLRDDLEERNNEMKRLKELLDYKEEELARREEDIQYRERRVTEEGRRLEEAKKENSSLAELETKKRLEQLQSEVSKKEQEIKVKEEYLASKERDLRRREQGVIEGEISKSEEERAIEVKQEKVKTGNPRLDDLLMGGIPFGSNVLIYGPPFVSKEVLIAQFMAEGLKKGVPCIWVLTDKTAKDIREEMSGILSGYEEYEALGLVRYIDSYSMTTGDVTNDKFTVYIEKPTDLDKISEELEKTAKEIKEKHEYYRVAFRSVSTVVAYSDSNAAFRFLSPLCGKRKRDKAVSLFSIEKGMHSEQDIQMLGSIMDGMIDFKVDQLKTFFAVKGITDVQSRNYIKYSASRHGLSIGSFALDHIK